jgi:hypothetical protein
MALVLRNGAWYWRKMVDGVKFNRSTKTDDKKLAETLARKWEHEAVKTVVYDGERPVTVHDATTMILKSSSPVLTGKFCLGTSSSRSASLLLVALTAINPFSEGLSFLSLFRGCCYTLGTS